MIIHTFFLDDRNVNLVDLPDFDESGKIVRALQIPEGEYSAIYFDAHEARQPIFIAVQDEILRWSETHTLKKALVLGGAGCTLPRFLLLQYPNIQVTVVENNEQMISIAKEYFLMDLPLDRIEFMNTDAFELIKTVTPNNYDLIVVDLFNAYQVCQEVFSDDFVKELQRLSTNSTLIGYNVSGAEESTIADFVNRLGDKARVEEEGSQRYVFTN